MPWIGALASVAGGLLASDSAGDAADTQSAAAREASAIQERARLQQRSDLSPWMQGGVGANNELLKRMGVGGGTGGGAVLTQEQLRAQFLPQFTRAGGAGDGSGLDYNNPIYNGENEGAGAIVGYRPLADTGSPQIDEAGLNAAVQQAMAQQQAQQAQYQAQAASDPNFGSLLAPAPAYKQFTQQDLNNDLVFQNTYKAAIDTGTNALNARAANSGSWGSGAALKALTRFGAQETNKYTGDAYNRNWNQQADSYNRNMAGKQQTYDFLSGVSRQGQSAAAGVGAAGIATGNAIAGNALASGNAQSAGIVGGANALSGGISDATSAWQWNQLLSKPKTASSGGWGTGTGYGNQDYGSYL
ncbi:hypothetical protein [Polaromonas sp. YR568]|uniref:hypothetical protein n=1 Tax=Polaromonas sp. YR568 TaxID=1855301 RepID=UPI003137E218